MLLFQVTLGHCPPAPPVATGPGLDRPLMPDYNQQSDSGGSGQGGYTMTRTRMFYHDQYGAGDAGGQTTGGAGSSATSSSTGTGTSTVLHFPDRPGVSDRKTSAPTTGGVAPFYVDSPRR